VIDSLFVDDEATVLADSFNRIGSNSTVALGALVRVGVSLYVFVECRRVGFSGCHDTHEDIH